MKESNRFQLIWASWDILSLSKVQVHLEVDELGEVGVLDESLVQVAAHQAPDLLQGRQAPALLLTLPWGEG